MKKYSKQMQQQTRVMESETIQKNGVRLNGKRFLVLWMLMACTAQIHAQETKTNELPRKRDLIYKSFHFGVKQGLNISNINTDVDYKLLNKLNYSAGFTFEFRATKWLSFQPEIIFSPKGFNLENQGVISDLSWIAPLIETSDEPLITRYSYNQLYIEVPVYLIIKTPVGFNFGAGVYAALMSGGKEYEELYQDGHRVDKDYIVTHKSNAFYNIIPRYSDNPYKENSDYYDKYNLDKYRGDHGDLYYSYYSNLLEGENKFESFDYGLSFMAEYQMPFGVVIGASYAKGMTNVVPVMAESNYFMKNSNINIYLEVKF
ncbi:MAG: PorT family protein [Dysgonamonadaceae bacterium]|jgi:hypothetical protein|nr:PorT family protein [Dysgonamonadaceae bacterium]